MAAKDDYLMDTLIDMGLITQEQVDEASGEVTDTHGVIDVLVAKGELFDESVTMAKATQAGLEMVELEAMQLDDSVISAVPRNIVKRFNAVPIFANDDSVTMAMSDPTDLRSTASGCPRRQVDIHGFRRFRMPSNAITAGAKQGRLGQQDDSGHHRG